MKAQSWEQIVGLPDQGEIEVDRLRAQLDRVTRERDGCRCNWRPGTYMNGL